MRLLFVQSLMTKFLYLPVELWVIGFLILWKIGKIAHFYNVVLPPILVGFFLLLFVFPFKRSLPFFLNSLLFQLWFYLSLRYNNFLLDRPVWNLFFFGLIYPFVIISWLGFFMDYDSFFTFVVCYLMLITLYNRVVYIFLNPSIQGTSFEVSSPQDISWENIMKSVSSFCEYHTGRGVANKLGRSRLNSVFPNIQRRFMFRKAAEVVTSVAENSGSLASVLTVVTASAAVGGLVLLLQPSQHKESLRADAGKKEREWQFQLKRDQATREFEAIEREKDRNLQRELFEKKEKLSTSTVPDSGSVEALVPPKSISEETIVKATSLSIDKEEWYSKLLEILFFFL